MLGYCVKSLPFKSAIVMKQGNTKEERVTDWRKLRRHTTKCSWDPGMDLGTTPPKRTLGENWRKVE